jgi:hypothetical protein
MKLVEKLKSLIHFWMSLRKDVSRDMAQAKARGYL